MRIVGFPLAILILITAGNAKQNGISAAETNDSGSAAKAVLPLVRFFEAPTNNHYQLVAGRGGGGGFRAVVSEEWPPGLVPIFAQADGKTFRLSRLPPEGRQQEATPLFFIEPGSREVDTANLAGRWEVDATNSNGSRPNFAWELTASQGVVAGRFDPQTDYRFATIQSGRLASNRCELTVTYFNARYRLIGLFHEGQWTGSWREAEDEEHGAWVARRPRPVPFTLPKATVPFYEWRRGEERRYRAEPGPGPGWDKATEPLGRVWPDE